MLRLIPLLILVPLVCVSTLNASPNEPTLSIKTPEGTRVFTRAELLARKDRVQIEVKQDHFTYDAVPIQALFEGVKLPKDAVLQYHCLDGFSAPISPARLFDASPTASHAFLAIETKNAHWPVIKPGTAYPTAGPFYLIWTHPKASQIGQEEWPYQLDGFELKPGLRASYPKLFPAEKLAESHPVNRGLKVFTKNCFSCHTFNQQGEAKMGPDLNFPMSPTEYLTPEALKRLIRNPQDVRFWPQAKMKGFNAEALPDSEIEDLQAYFKYMAQHRK